jgi:AcrR family transcriptional regulator
LFEANRPPVSAGAMRILRAAIRLFIKAGGTGFTTRGVAKEAGLSLGAVQHFFRTRDQLMAAMLEQFLSEYGQAYDRLSAELPFNGEARLMGALDYLVADAWRPDARRFFFNLYALSCHNPFVARLFNEVYVHHRRRIAGFIGAARPNLTEQQCYDFALEVAALLEGLMVYTAPGAASVRSREHLTELVKDSVRRLITLPGPQQAGSLKARASAAPAARPPAETRRAGPA